MEHHWPNIPDALAIPFRKFEKRRQRLTDPEPDDPFWATEEGIAIMDARAAMDELEARVRLG